MGGEQTRLSDGTWEDPVDVTLHQRPVSVEGMAIPVLSLEYEYRAYLALGRRETAALLHEWLARG